MLTDGAAEVLDGPGIGLHRALRIGVAAEVGHHPARGCFTDPGHQLAQGLIVQDLNLKALGDRERRCAMVGFQLGRRERNADALTLIFRGIAEQIVHHRPEALLLAEQRTRGVRRTAAVPAGCFPAHDALLDDRHADAVAG